MQEANSYFELAHEIFDLLLGPFHYRTITVRKKIEKVKFLGKKEHIEGKEIFVQDHGSILATMEDPSIQ